MQANRRGDLGQGVAMSIVRRRHPGAAVGMPVLQNTRPDPKYAKYVSGTYGTGYPLPVLAAAVTKVKYLGLNL